MAGAAGVGGVGIGGFFGNAAALWRGLDVIWLFGCLVVWKEFSNSSVASERMDKCGLRVKRVCLMSGWREGRVLSHDLPFFC